MFRSFKIFIRDSFIHFLVELLLFILKMFKIFIKWQCCYVAAYVLCFCDVFCVEA